MRYDNRLFQLERQSGRPPARSRVLVYEASDGQIDIRYRDRVMRWTELPPAGRPVAPTPSAQVTARRNGPRRTKPQPLCADHPWRHAVDDYYTARELAKARRAWEAVQP